MSETESTTRSHWLDDPDLEIGIEDAEGPNAFIYVLGISILIAVAYLLTAWSHLG